MIINNKFYNTFHALNCFPENSRKVSNMNVRLTNLAIGFLKKACYPIDCVI